MKKLMNTIAIFMIAFFVFNSNTKTPSTYQLVSRFETYEKAVSIANTYDVNIIEYKDSGITTFEVDDIKILKQLETMGFYQPTSLYVDAKPIPVNSDPYLNDQYAIPMLEISTAWNLTEGSSDLMVAIIDTGIDTDNPEFTGRISPLSYNSRTETVGLAAVEDDNGHGTNVAGVLAANKGNNIGIAGVLQQASILVIKANQPDDPLTEDNESNSFNDADVADGIYYAVNQGVKIINLSLGGPSINSIMRDAIKHAVDSGVLVVASSGNDGDSTINYPAAYDGVISVGSIDESKLISSFSTYNTYVDFVTPGSAIVTTSRTGGYVSVNGTSFSSPYLAGVAGLIWSYNPTLTANDVYQLLQTYAEDLGVVGKDNYYGYGLVKAYQSMTFDTFTVSFETFDGTYIDPVEVIMDGTFSVNDPEKAGYTFLGWYKDASFDVPFDVGVDTVTSDLMLYARYQINQYQMTIYDGQSVIYNGLLDYSSSLSFIPVKTDYTFIGYYMDQAFQVPYNQALITSDTVLYAKFEREPYQVDYVIKGEIVKTEFYTEGSKVVLYSYNSIYPFVGWYLDQTYQDMYIPDVITSDLTLYGKLDDGTYTVNFYDGNDQIIHSLSVISGSVVNMTLEPTKSPETPFDYMFIGWNQTFNNVTSDLDIFPIFEAVYNPTYVTLGKSIDTLTLGMTYQEMALNFTDERLDVIITSNLDESTPGTYSITYQAYYQSLLVDERVRIVTILAKPETVIITLNKGIDTIVAGKDYIEAGATANYGEVTISGEVDTNTPGEYVMTYRVTYLDQTYERIRYVTVLANTAVNQLVIWYKKEDIV
ncbi:MAG: S8 family serine peptidase [Acholeplasma sp.]|jgi:uncharacterized repeat protein (TIGR02543 family)|nr:S8 family serine peptidase [Acholeplasma sp.]